MEYTTLFYNKEKVSWKGFLIFLPFQKVKFELPFKSKIYMASDSQVDTVMQGKRIDRDKPFLSVDKKMNSATLKLNNRE